MGAEKKVYAQFLMEIFAYFSPNQDLTLLLFVFRDSLEQYDHYMARM